MGFAVMAALRPGFFASSSSPGPNMLRLSPRNPGRDELAIAVSGVNAGLFSSRWE
jgi:hypothetical protein